MLNELIYENKKLKEQVTKNKAIIEMLIGSWKENSKSDNVRKEAMK